MILGSREKDEAMFEMLHKINDASFAETERASRNKFIEHFVNDDVFVDDALTPAGFAFVTERDGPYIVAIAVDERRRKSGIGTALLQEINEHYKDREHIQLMCQVDNWEAQRVYLKNGFRVVRVAPRYYGIAGDGILMRRIS